MKIVLLHYHLKPGGVATVLRQQLDALKDDCEILIITGEQHQASMPAETVYVPGIGYDDAVRPSQHAESIAEAIIKTINEKWPNGCDVLHVHNPMLAKNRNFLNVLRNLQKGGINLFLQIHDFAEDGRPAAYYKEDEYPENCHYGVINSRDYNILLKSGLKKEGLHKIPNTVTHYDFKNDGEKLDGVCLYPVRAIRRKNIGEALLLSLFFSSNERLGITQPPNSPEDIESYYGWKNFSKANSINVKFDASSKYGFENLIASSKLFITTSITEGFGFTFLEPWTLKKLIWGRKLPEICQDFEKNGVNLDHLYPSLMVPTSWIGKAPFFKRWETAILKAYDTYAISIDPEEIKTAFDKITKYSLIDFGMLNEAYQKQAILYLLSDKKNFNILKELNPQLAELNDYLDSTTFNHTELINQNYNAVINHYNLLNYRDTLMDIYTKVVNTPVSHHIDKQALLLQYLNFKSFSLLKWSRYIG